MRNVLLIPMLSILLVTLTSGSLWAAPELSKEVKLQKGAHTAVVQAPSWRVTSSNETTAVLERAPDRTKKVGFGLLMLAVEEGPEKVDAVDWDAVRNNIVAAAKAAGSPLRLELKEDFKGAQGWTGRRLVGTAQVEARTVQIEMIALVAPKVLLTISSVGRTDDAEVEKLATVVAASAKLTSEP